MPHRFSKLPALGLASAFGAARALGAGGRLGLYPAQWLLLWVAAWLVFIGAISGSPPVDNAEQLTWVRSLEWGYYKHPPLPTLLLWPLVQVFGLQVWVTYAAAALVSVGALLLARRLTTELCGVHVANLALLGTLCIGYFSHRLAYFNHDILLLLCSTAAAWCCWRALSRGSLLAWIGVGLALGLGGLAKYQIVLTACSVFACWILHQGWRDAGHRRGLFWAAFTALAVFSPHLHWVISHDFQPLHYAARNALSTPMGLLQCSVGAVRWIGNQLSQFSGALALGTGLLLWARLRGGDARQPVDATRSCADARAFLWCWGLMPLLLMPVMAVIVGGKLHTNWGTAFMPFTAAALMQLVGRDLWSRVRQRDALLGFALVQLALMAYLWTTTNSSAPVFDQHRSHRFASQQVADTIAPGARHLLGGNIRVIAGRQRLVSVLALRLPERPLVMIDGRHELSPWLPQDMRPLCGILWVGGAEDSPPYEAVRHDIGHGLWWAVELLSDNPAHCR